VTRAAPWGDPAVEAGFAAAYTPSYAPVRSPSSVGVEEAEDVDPSTELPPEPVPTPQDELDEEADRAARPLTRTGRRARAPRPARLSPTRAVAGAVVSVAGVVLGIGTLLWISEDPSRGPGPVVQAPLGDVASQPEAESAPVDPPAPSAAAAMPAPEPVAPEPAAPAPQAPAPPAAAPSVVVPVLVLNNSRTTGLADEAAARFEAAGWPVRDTGNFRGRIRATTIYYPPGQRAAAEEFARRFDGIERVLPRFEGLPGSGLTVVLTRDFA
jgi:hypothetical protein